MGVRRTWVALLAGLLLGAGAGASTARAQAAAPAEEAETAPEAPIGDPSLLAYWEQRLERALQRIELARRRATEAETEYSRARHDDYPRGEALNEIKEKHLAAERELRRAEEALPRLVEQARRAGVPPGVLRHYRDEIEGESEEG
jgi:hypothetical protein